VDVVLRAEATRWVVEIIDHGAAGRIHDEGGAGIGLVGMRERVELLGGTLDVGPWQHGWRVRAELPADGPRR